MSVVKVEAQVEQYLDEQEIILSSKVICDESNNPPEAVAQGILTVSLEIAVSNLMPDTTIKLTEK